MSLEIIGDMLSPMSTNTVLDIYPIIPRKATMVSRMGVENLTCTTIRNILIDLVVCEARDDQSTWGYCLSIICSDNTLVCLVYNFKQMRKSRMLGEVYVLSLPNFVPFLPSHAAITESYHGIPHDQTMKWSPLFLYQMNGQGAWVKGR
jgi:hypothetical protein